MSKRNLNKFLDRINPWRVATKRPVFDINKIDDAVAQELFDILDSEVSPENLHCDGEITRAQAQIKANIFYGAGDELHEMGFRSKEQWSEFA